MGKIKKLQDKGATILPLTVADAVLMNSAEAGNLSTYLEALKIGVDFLLSIIGEDQAGDIFLKTKDGMPRGFYTEGFVSAGGKSPTEGGGSGGVNLTQMWESLQGNNDTFKDRLINVAHIPTLTTGKISDFVSATQAIANTAVANKADKATTLEGYGITDAFTWKGVVSSTTTDDKALWGEIGIQTYVGALPDGLTNQYRYGVLASFNNNKNGGPQFHLYASDYIGDESTNRRHIAWRTGFGADKGTWQRLANIDTENIFTESPTFQKQIKSTIATGTAPFSVASTTLVTNLNADMLDGKHLNDILNSNVASATKLKMPRLIWGQSFDGTKDVSGAMSNVIYIKNTDEQGVRFFNSATYAPTNAGDLASVVLFSPHHSFGLAIWGLGDGSGHIQVGRKDGTNKAYKLCLQEFGGNVGIGTTTPSEKLHVEGNIYTSDSLKIASATFSFDSANGNVQFDKGLHLTNTSYGLKANYAAFSKKIIIGGATISWDATNGCLKVDKGLYSTDFVSAGGVVTGNAGGGSAGLSLSEMWNSLTDNIDPTYGQVKINISHIPISEIIGNSTYTTDVANRIKNYNYSESETFTNAVKALIVADNIPTLEMSKIDGLETTLTNIGTVVQNNYDNLNESISTLQNGTIADHEARIKAIEQALTWQTV